MVDALYCSLILLNRITVPTSSPITVDVPALERLERLLFRPEVASRSLILQARDKHT